MSNAESNTEHNDTVESDDDLPESTGETIYWDDLYDIKILQFTVYDLYDTINRFTTFEQLQQYVETSR